jgi:Zn-finger nucleic acid-binding protein
MTCPACDRPTLVQQPLEPGLDALQCGTCHGAWVRLKSYLAWRERQQSADGDANATDAPLTASPSAPVANQLRRCPDCRAILGRWRVGHGASFQIDRCAQCDGTWFDDSEWQALRALGLAPQLLAVFSPEWQQGVRRAEQAEAQERRFVERLGDEDIARAREIREWLATHPRRAEVLAYLELVPGKA